MDNNMVNTHGIRIVELPACTMATSSGQSVEAFDRWWSARDKHRRDKFFPRDFMYHDAQKNELVWLYALSDEVGDNVPYDTIEFPGGLYAVAVSIDQNDRDGERVYHAIKNWIVATNQFTLDEQPDRPTLFHVITPDTAFAKMQYRQLDIFVPVL